jgi:NTP pyrophosphatase (non-canonical NTP hydrolase)
MMAANGLAKLVEELGELSQVAGKKMAYIHTDIHPDGAGSLQARLENEAGDVQAAILFVTENFSLDADRIARRTAEKLATFRAWHQSADGYACHCDLEPDDNPDGCVFDGGQIHDCAVAVKLKKAGAGRNDCTYWRPLDFLPVGENPSRELNRHERESTSIAGHPVPSARSKAANGAI